MNKTNITRSSSNIKRQKHYTKFKIQPMVYIMVNGIGYAEGHVIKYVTRHKLKGKVKDLKKAKHFLEVLIREYETGVIKP